MKKYEKQISLQGNYNITHFYNTFLREIVFSLQIIQSIQ